MIIFRMIGFVFRLAATLMLILMLQISIGGQTLEDYLMNFIRNSESMAPVRNVAYSSIRSIKSDIQIKEPEPQPARLPASVPPQAGSHANLQTNQHSFTNMAGQLMNMIMVKYGHFIQQAMERAQKTRQIDPNASVLPPDLEETLSTDTPSTTTTDSEE